MMKSTIPNLALLILFLLFYQGDLFGQARFEKLKGMWISADQEIIEIEDTTQYYYNHLSNSMLEDRTFHVSFLSNIISFQERYTSSRTNFKVNYVDRYDLKIISCNDSLLIVKPVSSLSKSFFQNKTLLKFKKREFLVDNTIKFEKIIYHTTTAWSSPSMGLEILANKSFYLIYQNNNEHVDNRFESGRYSGVLPDTVYQELIELLQSCNLRTLKFAHIKGADSPESTLIIYFDGNRKYLSSMFPPRIAEDLIQYLYSLNENVKLTKTKEVRKLEY